MSLVGTALTGLAFVIYKQRASISLPAVAGTAMVSSVFSVLATMGASNILGVTAGALYCSLMARAAEDWRGGGHKMILSLLGGTLHTG